MSKLEYDLENFGRLCHLHDKVAKLEQALAEKDQEIAQLRNEVALLKADDAEGCELIRDMEDEERRKDAVIEEQAQEIARLREALTNCKRELWHCNKQLVTNGWNEGGSVTRALEQAQQALKETTT